METKFTNEKLTANAPCENKGWVDIECERGIIGRTFWGDFPTKLTKEEAIANAKLFAASQKMFEALSAMIRIKDIYMPSDINEVRPEHYDEMTVLFEAFRQMEDAIKKTE